MNEPPKEVWRHVWNAKDYGFYEVPNYPDDIRYIRDDGWHPASEPPDTERDIIVADSKRAKMGFYSLTHKRYYADWWDNCKPSHWCERPQLPKEEA